MKFKSITAVAVLGILVFGQTAFATNNTLTYKNTRGSLLKLQFHSDNTLTGSFTTAVASKDCQKAIGMKRPVVGYIAQNALTFIVNYPACGAVVTFIGNIEQNNTVIDTTAIVARQSSQIATEGPGARMISHDVFTQV